MFDVAGFLSDGSSDGLAIGHHWFARGNLNAWEAVELIDRNFEVQLTHTGEDELFCFWVGVCLDGGVIAQQPLQCIAQLGFVVRFVGNNSHADDGLGEGDRLQSDGRILAAKGIAGECAFETDDRNNVAWAGNLEFFPLVTHHAV